MTALKYAGMIGAHPHQGRNGVGLELWHFNFREATQLRKPDPNDPGISLNGNPRAVS